jgi:hypothetical protein
MRSNTANATRPLQPTLHRRPATGRQLSCRTGQSIRCDVIFGSPSNDCRGTGVCRISALRSQPGPAPASRDCQRTTAICQAADAGKRLCMVLRHELLCPQLWRRHLRHECLTLLEPCVVPADVVQAIGLTFNVLSPGTYPIERCGNFYRIQFEHRAAQGTLRPGLGKNQ